MAGRESKSMKLGEIDIEKVREQFPVLHQRVHGHSLVYLDNAATSQKPQCVIDAVEKYYCADNANIHRGVHELSQRATLAYEGSRKICQSFLGAEHLEEIIFVRGATEGINLVAQSYGRPRLKPGDEIIISQMEHHSNIVPWQMLCEQTGASLKVIAMNEAGELDLESYERLLGPKTKIVAIAHVSNALGTINPIESMIQKAHAVGAVTVIDGAQAAPHHAIDVQKLDADFYTISGHKVYGPTGIGVLYGKRALLESMTPYQGGGDMILTVTLEKTQYNELPYKFEAGTPNIAGVIGLGAALNFVSRLDLETIAQHEKRVLDYGTQVLGSIEKLRFIGTAQNKAAVLSFVIEGIHPHDVGTIVDQQGVAIRTGHHCAQPVMDFFGISATSRASLAVYNTKEEIDKLAQAIKKVIEVFG